MFCGNCGRKREADERFCADCGTRFEVVSNLGVTLGQKNEKKKSNGSKLAIVITLAVIGIIVLGIVGIVALVIATLGKYEKQEYVKLGTDQIATIYNVVGKREINSYNSSFSNSQKIISFGYVQGAISDEDLEGYGESLVEEGFYYYRSADTEFSYVKDSSKTGMVIIIYTTYNSIDEVTMNYQLSYGDFEDYKDYIETTKKKEIGTKNYGYMEIPEDWEKYEDTSELNFLQYASKDESALVSMYAKKEETYTIEEYVDAFIDTYDEKNVNCYSKETTVLGYDAYVITTFEKGITKKEWIFIDDNKNLHYIAIASSTSDADVFNLIDTYYIVKKVGL